MVLLADGQCARLARGARQRDEEAVEAGACAGMITGRMSASMSCGYVGGGWWLVYDAW